MGWCRVAADVRHLLCFSHSLTAYSYCFSALFLYVDLWREKNRIEERRRRRKRKTRHTFDVDGAYDSSYVLDVSWHWCCYFNCVADYSSLRFSYRNEKDNYSARERKNPIFWISSRWNQIGTFLFYRKMIHHLSNEETRQNFYFFSWRYRCKQENKEDTRNESEKNCYRLMRRRRRIHEKKNQRGEREGVRIIDRFMHMCFWHWFRKSGEKNNHLVCIDLKKKGEERRVSEKSKILLCSCTFEFKAREIDEWSRGENGPTTQTRQNARWKDTLLLDD